MMINEEETQKKKLSLVLICVALVLLTIIAYWPIKDCEFTNLDDNRYVYGNGCIQSGLSLNSVKWAFSVKSMEITGNWHPLTWLSLMLDYQIFGLNPHGYHLINLLFHIINSILLFLILQGMTKTPWQSIFVAGLFAIHPLHIESVAWIAERKDVLSTFFWMITMAAYIYYVERPGLRRYVPILLFFVLGLMAKPMLVTLPFVLLLLDYWPLYRFQEIESNHKFQWSLTRPLLWEKVPLLVLAMLSCIVTYIAQQKAGTLRSLEEFPLSGRIANASVSYIIYIVKMLWPSNLAVVYPHPSLWPIWHVLGALLIFITVTLIIIWRANRFPYLVNWMALVYNYACACYWDCAGRFTGQG